MGERLAASTFLAALAIATAAPMAAADQVPNSEIKEDLFSYAALFPQVRRQPDEDWIDYNLRYIATPDIGPYSFAAFGEQTDAIKWNLVSVLASTTIQGVVAWDWGSTSFHFNSEGFFGRDTGSLGMDKLGHAFTTYLYAELFTDRIAHQAPDLAGAAITGAILAFGVQTYVEVFDGFSDDHGFAYEDLIMNGLGAGFSVLRTTVPGLREKVDFRMEYIPSGDKGFKPVSDYSGQKYLLAFKLAGFEALEDTPLRFLEVHAGYFARGHSGEERARDEPLRQVPYAAVGINLSELLLSGEEVRRSKLGTLARRGLEYIQVPYTYIATEQD